MFCLSTILGTIPLLLADSGGGTSDYPVRPVPFTSVKIEDRFWAPRMRTNSAVTVWSNFRKCEETGRIANFAVAAGLQEGDFEGIYYNDSDVFKVIEGAAYTLAIERDPRLEVYLDDLIVKIAGAQEEDGYLYTIRTIRGEDTRSKGPGAGRWSNLRASHELYNVGHLYEAAVAHYMATGKRTLLDVAIKNADLIDRVFGPLPGQRRDAPGHQEIELALVKLYRVTRDQRYLKLAEFLLEQRGRAEGHTLYGAYSQDHKPVTEQEEAVGHAVRAGYMFSAMTDIAALTGNTAYAAAVDRLWDNVVTRKMYVTGGIGARSLGEAFGDDYELPNAGAYSETCASIAHALWNYRMFLLHGEAKYLDVLERVLYNGFLAGVSFSGDQFFYPNPLAYDGHSRFNQGTAGRAPWFDCACCPVNVVRFIPSIPGYVYAVGGDNVYINLYVSSSATLSLDDTRMRLTQSTDYPWDGRVRMEVVPERASPFELRLRIPGWVQGRPVPGDLYRYAGKQVAEVALRVNGEAVPLQTDKGFACLRRMWQPSDVVELDMPMTVRRVLAHESVEADVGRVALERGPLVYCVEGVDNAGYVADLILPDDGAVTARSEPGLLQGVTVIRAAGRRLGRATGGTSEISPFELTAIPYYAWAHREVGPMEVWLARTAERARARPAPSIASRSRAGASHVWSADTVAALNDQVEPASSGDQSITRFTWWDHRGGTEWVQYEFAELATVSDAEIYWFDDTGAGQCRVPGSWRLLYRVHGEWMPVPDPSGFQVAKDCFNRTTFRPVATDALRVEVSLQEGFSGGILEWKVQ